MLYYYLSPESTSCYIVILLFFKYRLGLLTKILVWFQQIITTYIADHLKISFSDIQSTLANSLTELNIRFNFDVVFSPWMKVGSSFRSRDKACHGDDHPLRS